MSDHIHDYNSIKVLNGLSGIRKKLGMYIGSTSSIDGVKMPKAILQIIQELLSNSLDEVSLMKEKSTISLIVDSNENSIEINDFGRGIPKGPGDSFSEVKHAFTVPHSSGKFDQKAYGSMGTAGMHGIGIKAVNAASKMMQIEAITRATFLDDKKQIQTDHKKKVKYSLTFNQDQIVESSQEEIKDPKDEIQTGSKIKAYLDDGLIDDTSDQVLFNDLIWNFNEIEEMLKLNVALVPNAIIDFTFIQSSDQSSDQASNEIHKTYSYDNGILSYAQELIGESDQYIYFKSDMFEYHRKSFQYDVVFKYDDESQIYSYANTVKTPLGGSHQNAILNALVSAIQNYAKQTNKSTKTLKKKLILDSLDVLVHAQIDNSIVTFEGQTKDLLSTPLAEKAIFENASTTLLDCLYDNPAKADQLIDQLIEKDKLNNAKAKVEKSFKEASKQLNKKTKLSVLSKLKAASSKNPEEKELYIVEGDSASNIGRDTKTQAVFPIRGKIKNVYELPIDQALKNKEVSTIIAAIGAGVGTEFDLDKMQYHKIILAMDVDSDGFHIRSLLCGLFVKLFPGIIEAGRLYAVNPPLYKVITYQNGKPNIEMIYSEEEMRHYKMPKNAEVERYKGLGEMELDEAHAALANPETRRLTRYVIENEKIVEETFSKLLGNDNEGRRKWAFDLNFDDDVAE